MAQDQQHPNNEDRAKELKASVSSWWKRSQFHWLPVGYPRGGSCWGVLSAGGYGLMPPVGFLPKSRETFGLSCGVGPEVLLKEGDNHSFRSSSSSIAPPHQAIPQPCRSTRRELEPVSWQVWCRSQPPGSGVNGAFSGGAAGWRV